MYWPTTASFTSSKPNNQTLKGGNQANALHMVNICTVCGIGKYFKSNAAAGMRLKMAGLLLLRDGLPFESLPIEICLDGASRKSTNN